MTLQLWVPEALASSGVLGLLTLSFPESSTVEPVSFPGAHCYYRGARWGREAVYSLPPKCQSSAGSVTLGCGLPSVPTSLLQHPQSIVLRPWVVVHCSLLS